MGGDSRWYTGNGLLLEGNGKGGFTLIKDIESGLYAPGDVKDMVTIRINGANHFIVA